jgi:hypothetical protein
MYILNNINDRNYKSEYKDIRNVIFDISEKQLENNKNKDWFDITHGNIVCVIKSSRKICTFYIVEENKKTKIIDPIYGATHVITGKVIAKTLKEEDMSSILNRLGVSHPYLPNNKFSIGFNVAYVGEQMNELPVKTKNGQETLKTVVENNIT